MREKRIRKGMGLVALSCLMAFVMAMTAFADFPAIDLNKTGSITINMNTRSDGTGDPVGGGEMTIYRVAEVSMDQASGDYSYLVIEPFTGSGYDFEGKLEGKTGENTGIDWAHLAEEFSDYVYENDIAGESKKITENGTVIFDGLYPGLYLLVQTEPADGYYEASPFLVSLPRYNEDSLNPDYIYTVNASPKVEVYPGPAKDVDVDLTDYKDYGDDGVRVSVGQTLTYKVTFWNGHPYKADMVITDELDSHVEYVEDSATAPEKYECDITYEDHTLTWSIKDVDAYYQGEVTFQVTVLSLARTAGVVTNDADVKVNSDPSVRTNRVSNPLPGSSRSSGGGGGGSGSGGGGSGSGGPGDGDGSSGDGSIWDLLPLPQTGQGWAMLIAVCAMVIAGVALIVLHAIKRKE